MAFCTMICSYHNKPAQFLKRKSKSWFIYYKYIIIVSYLRRHWISKWHEKAAFFFWGGGGGGGVND